MLINLNVIVTCCRYRERSVVAIAQSQRGNRTTHQPASKLLSLQYQMIFVKS
ncbi:hypothetical protein [Phormidium nigroviride]